MKHVAVLGAGIMGGATALFLARRGARVTLFDAADQPFAGASRWNEGKVHLGYLYSADPSLETARRVLPGGLAFKVLTEELIGCSLDQAVTSRDDTYLVHRDSVVGAEATERYFAAMTALAMSHENGSSYFVPVTAARRLSQSELNADYETAQIVAGFRVPERSVSTLWVADRFVDALAAEPRIEQRMRTLVRGVRGSTDALASPLFVETDAGTEGPFTYIVNALWEGRLAIDAGLGLPLPTIWSHRFRLSAFLRALHPVAVPNTVISTGPFGDVKSYNGKDFYLSWYLTGLVAEGTAVKPPQPPCLEQKDQTRIIGEIIDQLGRVVRSVLALRTCTEKVRLGGGWVYAAGRGSLADPTSTLHRRDRIGITHAGSYISVDTGKYSIAPWLAREIAGLICSDAP
jgi:FAD dependent oxidoreductase